MAKTQMPDADYLRNLLDYDPASGKLAWRPRPISAFQNATRWKRWNTMFAGKPAFESIQATGYKYGSIDGKSYYAHRLIWKIAHGSDPLVIDHINGDGTDNRLANLRNVDHAQNSQNMKLSALSLSGAMGVVFYKNRWVAQICHRNKRIYLGRFSELGDAIAVRKAAEREYGFHENHGRKTA